LTKVDLHVHSRFSDHPSEWILQRLGAAESYTDPQFIYRTARERGMTFVTITDHNRIEGSLLLKERYPAEVFTGVEVTATFPEDECDVHVLVYGLDEAEFAEIDHLRQDVYELRDYLKERDLAHSVAHATFAVNGRLTLEHLEKLVLLFDCFEGINGGRNRLNNDSWVQALHYLTPSYIELLYARHRIEPFSDTPWVKGFTGGSDDHAGLFIGQTFTVTDAPSVAAFLRELKSKHTCASGRHSDYRSLAFTLYKLVYEFARHKGSGFSKSILGRVSDAIFDDQKMSLKDKFVLKRLKAVSKKKRDHIRALLLEMVEELNRDGTMTTDQKLDLLHDNLSEVSDEFLRAFVSSCEKDLSQGDVAGLIKGISALLPSLYLSLPFLATFHHLFSSRRLLDETLSEFANGRENRARRVLWFTDTINDMNGVSVTLKKIGWLAHEKGMDIRLVTALGIHESIAEAPPETVRLPFVYDLALPYYEDLHLRVPSILKALKLLNELEPDEIFISTPGPVGLLGLLASRLLAARCVGIYHTDFSSQIKEIIGGESVAKLCEKFMKWFYASMDEVLVPTRQYIDILERRGIDRSKMRVFWRGVDTEMFRPDWTSKAAVLERLGVRDGVTLLYVGRISKDKNLDFLADVYRRVTERRPHVNLVIAGTGPYMEGLRSGLADCARVVFTGRLAQPDLPALYSAADLLVFPSITDTFGMTVLEAQACGLPALVSDKGGPQEIIQDGETGFVIPANRLRLWVDRVEDLIDLQMASPDVYWAMRNAARQMVLRDYNWDSALIHSLGEVKLRPLPVVHKLQFPGSVADPLQERLVS